MNIHQVNAYAKYVEDCVLRGELPEAYYVWVENETWQREPIHYYVVGGHLMLAATEVLKPIEATYIGMQEARGRAHIPLYNLLIDIPGHPKNSTVAEETLFKYNVRHVPSHSWVFYDDHY